MTLTPSTPRRLLSPAQPKLRLHRPGPQDSPIQGLIKRDKKNATFYFYLALSPSFTDKGKFLLAARRYRNGAHTEYIISLDVDDLSQGSKAYVGKLRLGLRSWKIRCFK